MCPNNTKTMVCGTDITGQRDDEPAHICNWSTTLLVMGLAINGFSPDNDHSGDEAAWQAALQPARLYDAVLEEAARLGLDAARPLWQAINQEMGSLLQWASRTFNGQGYLLLYQTENGQWHWDQNAMNDYDVMHAYLANSGYMSAEDWIEGTGSDGATVINNDNEGGGGDGGHQLIGEMRQALFDAAALCDTNQPNNLNNSLLVVQVSRTQIRQQLNNWGD